jgi:hypothetical protein
MSNVHQQAGCESARDQGDVTLTARSALGNAEWVSADTNEIRAEYAWRKFGVNVSRSSAGHHVSANPGAAQATSRPEAAYV